ncbi:hypothetical protein JST99_04975 [Candidatus Dependentiae bacterium]|nr:hypothetical protein [Candidatus Dependentiae bacterium]
MKMIPTVNFRPDQKWLPRVILAKAGIHLTLIRELLVRKYAGALFSVSICLALFPFLSTAALQDQELFLQANRLYQQQQYQQAEQRYCALQDKGYAVWFNLGNCAFRRCNYPQAYAYWLRAQREAPCSMQSVLEQNYAQLTAVYPGKQLSPSLSQQILVRLSPFYIQLVAAFFWILLWWFVMLGRWKKQRALFILITFLAFASGALAYWSYEYRTGMYAVTSGPIVVYSGPNEQYHAIGQLDEMTVCRLYDSHRTDSSCGEQHCWYKVSVGNSVGWILSRDIICV